jgi:hypothetical protein
MPEVSSFSILFFLFIFVNFFLELLCCALTNTKKREKKITSFASQVSILMSHFNHHDVTEYASAAMWHTFFQGHNFVFSHVISAGYD